MDNLQFTDDIFLDFEQAIQEYCSSITTETVTNSGKVIQLPLNLVNATQSQYHGLMQYIYNKYIKTVYSITITDTDRTDTVYSGIGKHSNTYNIDRVNTLLEWYIETCNRYDKAVTEVGFMLLTGISHDTLREWRNGNSNDKLTFVRREVAEKIRNMEEESLQSINITGKRNAVGIIEILNYKYGHSAKVTAAETTAKINALPASALPMLTAVPQQQIPGTTGNTTAEQQNSG